MYETHQFMKDGYGLFTDPYYLSFLPSLIDLVKQAKKAEFYNNPKRHLELQLGLLELIESTDKVVSEGKQEARKSGNNEILKQRKRNKTLAYAFRTVGDGMAWRSNGYTRFVISVLSQARSPGAANDKSGRKREVEWAKNAVLNGGYVMIHDITNTLRVGDLSLYNPVPDITPYLSEVKSNKDLATAKQIQEKLDAKKPITKQEFRLWQAQIMISTRRWYGVQTIAVEDVYPSKLDFLPSAGAIMKQAERKGVYGKYIAPYLYVDAFDFTSLVGKSIEELTEKLDLYKPPDRSDHFVMHSNYDNLDALHKTEVLRAVAPYTIFPFTSSVIAKLISGMMMTRTFLFKEPLKAAFLQLGYELKLDEAILDENYDNSSKKNSVDFLSSEQLFPDDFEDKPWIHIRHIESGFMFPAASLIAIMLHEFFSVEYIVSVAEFARKRAIPGEAGYSYHDIRDSYRWF
ncbi:MAG: hypothetical protein ABIQ04_03920 [Candidatus Saccharimonadales bacterium]